MVEVILQLLASRAGADRDDGAEPGIIDRAGRCIHAETRAHDGCPRLCQLGQFQRAGTGEKHGGRRHTAAVPSPWYETSYTIQLSGLYMFGRLPLSLVMKSFIMVDFPRVDCMWFWKPF